MSDDELREFIRENAEAEGDEADEVVEQVFASGRHEILREDLRMRKALDRVVADVKRIPLELAAAREALDAREGEGPRRDKIVDPRKQGAFCMSVTHLRFVPVGETTVPPRAPSLRSRFRRGTSRFPWDPPRS